MTYKFLMETRNSPTALPVWESVWLIRRPLSELCKVLVKDIAKQAKHLEASCVQRRKRYLDSLGQFESDIRDRKLSRECMPRVYLQDAIMRSTNPKPVVVCLFPGRHKLGIVEFHLSTPICSIIINHIKSLVISNKMSTFSAGSKYMQSQYRIQSAHLNLAKTSMV